MSLNSRCQCIKCGNTYSLFSDETKLLPGMKIAKSGKFQPKKFLHTWIDWVEHIATHCPMCRIRVIPKSCELDYIKQKERLLN